MQQTHIKYGLITSLAIIIAGVILHTTGLVYSLTNGWARHTPYLLLLFGIILNSNAFSNKNGNNVMFGQIFSSNFKVLAVVVLVSFFWSLLSIHLIFPDAKEKTLTYIVENWRQSGVPEGAIDGRIQPVRENFIGFSLGIHTFIILFFGAIFALIGAAIAKKKPRA